MKFSKVVELLSGDLLQGKAAFEIQDLVTDTRQLSVRRGGVFFAISGPNHDGHKYVNDAYQSGIKGFIVEKPVKLPDDASVFVTESAIHALQVVAAFHRSQFDYPVVGITGSNGKTIVKEWLAQMLDNKHSVIKSPKSYNSQIGVPLSVWPMSDHHNIGIFEAGISRAGEMTRLKEVIMPTAGIFTNIGEAHNEGFESKEAKAMEKALLFAQCKRVVYCIDHEIVGNALKKTVAHKQSLFGWQIEKKVGAQVQVSVPDGTLDLRIKFSDPPSVENCIHCAVMLHAFGFSQERIQERMDTLSTVKMRLEMKQAINRSYLIDDTYNNDLYGLEVAIGILNSNKQKPKKTVILSDMYQTGMKPAQLYIKVADMLKTNGVDRFVGIGPELAASRDLFQMTTQFYHSTEDFLADRFECHDEIILIKGSRKFEFERIVERLEFKAHGTVLEVNLENVVHNLNHFRSMLLPETKVMVMVKAYAYGGGNHEIANLLQFHKVDYLGVAYTDEAVDLRKNGVHIPIMIMNASPDSFRLLKEYNLEPEIYSLEQLLDFIEFFEGEEQVPAIHLKIETGMNRLGFHDGEIRHLIEQLKIHKQITVKSIFSHLAGSEDPRHMDYTRQQADTFEQVSQQILDSLWYKPMRHILNTGGIVSYPEYQYDMVRLGIGLYGYDPTESDQKSVQAVGTLKTMVSQIKRVKAGESIGYGRAGFAQKDTKIAIVPIGYADGYLRSFGNGVGKMLVNGDLVPTIGNICMDMTMLDITDLDVHSGDEVVVFGDRPAIKDLANWIHTIPYEILTNVSQRVKRTYLSG